MKIDEMRISPPAHGFPKSGGSLESQIERAEALAFSALRHLAGDEDKLNAFLGLAGLDLGGLRQAASEPGFPAALLDFICSDDSLVLGVAAQENIPPEAIGAAQRLLAGPGSHETD